jgi:hypothetical protein
MPRTNNINCSTCRTSPLCEEHIARLPAEWQTAACRAANIWAAAPSTVRQPPSPPVPTQVQETELDEAVDQWNAPPIAWDNLGETFPGAVPPPPPIEDLAVQFNQASPVDQKALYHSLYEEFNQVNKKKNLGKYCCVREGRT